MAPRKIRKNEAEAKASTSTKPPAKKTKTQNKIVVQEEPEPNQMSGFMTEPTIDENIYPQAKFKSFDDFLQKFSTWKAKHHHPFRVASSEPLRTESGEISQAFKYRYVVFHCARYGLPRKRGEGKRPNQKYLPCRCTAMMRLNFNFQDQMLRLTSLETRHSNHTVSPDLYEKMAEKELRRQQQQQQQQQQQKKPTPKRRRTITVSTDTSLAADVPISAKEELPEERADSEQSNRQSLSSADFNAHSADSTLNHVRFFDIPHMAPIVQPPLIATPTAPYGLGANTEPPLPTILPTTQFQPMDYQAISNQLIVNQMKLNAQTLSYAQLGTANWTAAPFQSPAQAIPQPIPPPPRHISPALSASVDENEAPKVFHNLDAIRPIPLRPADNLSFCQMINSARSTSSTPSTSPAEKAEIEAALKTLSKMLLDGELPQDVSRYRVKQLNTLIAHWNHHC